MNSNFDVNTITYNQLISYIISHLLILDSIDSVNEAFIESEILLNYYFRTNTISLRTSFENYKEYYDINRLNNLIIRRLYGEPLAYITGNKNFLDKDISVGHGVLIPRPETELLVEQAEIQIKRLSKNTKNIKIVDIGTGSGAIILSIANKLINNGKKYSFIGLDESNSALKYAQKNINRHQLSNDITLIKSNLLQKIKAPIHCIISNPPYIKTNEIYSLQKEIRCYEPFFALDGGENGIKIIDKLIYESSKVIDPTNFAIIIEIGINQYEQIKNIYYKYIDNCSISYIEDFHGIKRVAVATN